MFKSRDIAENAIQVDYGRLTDTVPDTAPEPTLPPVSPEQRAAAALALRKRRKVRETQANLGLLEFTQLTNPLYKVSPFHQLLADTLTRVLKGEILRLMIWTPPQHGKSELASVRFPAYWLGMRPNDPVMLASYGVDLASSKSKQARDIAESEVYKGLFPQVRVGRDSRSGDHWELAPPCKGFMKAVGVGGAATGNGAMLGIIDDPVKNAEEANSATHQKHLIDWYKQVFRTRIREGGAIVLIMTRWAEEDLAGQLINLAKAGEDTERIPWHVLRLPAVAESQKERDTAHERLGLPTGVEDPLGRQEGEPLAPHLYSIGELRIIEAEVGPTTWSTLYQMNPLPGEGNMFKAEWFEETCELSEVPKDCLLLRYWDKAATEADGACRTAGVLMAYHKRTGIVYVVDIVVGRWSVHNRENKIKQTAAKDARTYGSRYAVQIVIEQEPGSGGKESADATVKNLAGYRIKKDRPTGDKNARLGPYSDQADGGNVVLVKAWWNKEYITEITAIPFGKFRDLGDASSGAFNLLTGKKSTGAKAGSKGLYRVTLARKLGRPA